MVRRGLERWVAGRTVADVEVRHLRAVRRQPGGAAGLSAGLEGRTLQAARRRGKYLWLPTDDGEALLAHLGMSGQLLVQPPDAPDETHLRVRLRFADGGRELRFVDQRTFGGLSVQPMAGGSEDGVPVPVAHIARDPLDANFDDAAFAAALRRRHTGVKRALLDQSLVSGIGNIYADETLWRSRLHGDTPCHALGGRKAAGVLRTSRQVMAEALEQGGTSFDALYVNVNGSSGYFARHLDVYGREDLPCHRCGRSIVRDRFMNRSSFRCPRCQRLPRQVAPPSGQDATLGCKPS